MDVRATPHWQAPLTVEDLERLPDDGRRYELVDGRLDVSPTPAYRHTVVEGRLVYHLTTLAPEGFEVVPGPGMNLNGERTSHRIPDVAVVQQGAHPYLTTPPSLAVEVVSPESVFRDHHTKRREYAEFGIHAYWIVSPEAEKPGIVELRLDGGEYREARQAFGEDVFETDFPFAVRLVPHWLLADGPWRSRIGGA